MGIFAFLVVLLVVMGGALWGLHLWQRLQVCEAPLDWLLKSQKQTIRALGVAHLALSVQGLLVFACRGSAGPTCLAFVKVCACALSLVWVERWGDKVQPARLRHITLLFQGINVVASIWIPAFTTDIVIRHRLYGMVAILWRMQVPIFALRMTPCIVFLMAATFLEWIAMWFSCAIFHEEHLLLTLTVTQVGFSFGFAAWSYMWVSTWRTMYQSEKALVVEKRVLTALLSKVCDDIFWLAGDGETMTGYGKSLQALLGVKPDGSSLSDCFDEDERIRIQRWMQTNVENSSNVHLLTTAMVRQHAPPVTVDLFVADRRSAACLPPAGCPPVLAPSPGSEERGFLVGLRIAKSGDTDFMAEPPALEEGAAALSAEACENIRTWAASRAGAGADPGKSASACGAAWEPGVPGRRWRGSAALSDAAEHLASARRRTAPAAGSTTSALGGTAEEPGVAACPSAAGSAGHCSTEGSALLEAPLEVRNTFLHFKFHGAMRRTASAPAVLSEGAPFIPCPAHGQPATPPCADYEAPAASCDSASCLSADATDSGSGGSSCGVLVGAPPLGPRGPSGAIHEDGSGCARLSDLLRVRRDGQKSVGSYLHAQDRCIACTFEQRRWKWGMDRTPCRSGPLCSHCHEPHGETVSRRELRRRNRERSRAQPQPE